MKIGGKNVKTAYVVGGAVVVVGGVLVYRHYHGSSSGSSSAASTGSAIDPVTGLPASEDNTVDPQTGMTYLAEAQEYGSVAAAESQVSGQYSALGETAGAGIDSGYPAYGYSYPSSSLTGGTSYATNAQWAQAVTAGLTGLGYSSTDIAAALGLYFQGMPLGTGSDGASYLQIVQAAVAEFGPPPVGSYNIISGGSGNPPPSNNGGGGNPPPTTGGPPPDQHGGNQTPPAPSGLKVSVGSTTANLTWNAISGVGRYATDLDVPGHGSGVIAGTTHTFTGLASKKRYTAKVQAIGDSGKYSAPAYIRFTTT